MLRLAFDFIITWRETRTRPNAYVKYLVTYLEGTQQTTINPYELIVIPDGKSNSDYTRNLPSVF